MNLISDLKSATKIGVKESKIFISHSANDRQVVDRVLEIFDDTKIKPVLMEYEKWSRDNRPNWEWIRTEIEKSSALLVILTKGITEREHTQNWVAFEIGVAAECKPPKPVFVLREENINFPLPYLNYFFPYSLTTIKQVPFDWNDETKSRPSLNNEDQKLNVANAIYLVLHYMMVKILVTNPKARKTLEAKIHPIAHIQCNTCKIAFYYLGVESKFQCPCCSRLIERKVEHSW